MDRTWRANCKLLPEKILQTIFHWTTQSSVKLSKILLDVSDNTIVDSFNHCREVCRTINIQHFNNHKLGDGNGQRINSQPPEVVVQIDETLLCGKRRANYGRLLAADQTIPEEEIQEWEELNENGQLDGNRNHGRRIKRPWIFGLVECHKQPDGHYKSGEVRLIIVEKRNQEALLHIIRENVAKGSMILSDIWPPYMRIGQDDDGLIHEFVNHSERFVVENGVHTHKILKESGQS
ncbi:hypothetical protein RF11_05272 [Thelohanellus kitauei]|uniref:ISXO2-like transposase domain-containing protein n=1 Tax=Thelohanellus kitauei TaxID=669202 RepID=A0A0C2N555_THEKT|nr:hypothetical protein RF11_05272 [Thelohanellus kitauei]